MMKFDDLYKKYEEKLDRYSGGFVKPDKAEFLKMAVFYEMMQEEEKKECMAGVR